MAKKQIPAWKTMGLDGPPPVVRGFHDYGVLYTADQGPQRESLRHAWDTATWSWMYWGRKIRASIENARKDGQRRWTDRIGLALAWAMIGIHRPKG